MGVFDLESLDFFDYCGALSKSFVSVFAKEKLAALRPDKDNALAFQAQLSAVFELIGHSPSSFHLKNDTDFHEVYLKLIKTEPLMLELTAKDYLIIADFLLYSSELRADFINGGKSAVLSEITALIPADTFPAARIAEIFDKDGNILDGASGELKRIRNNISSSRQRSAHLLKSLFNLPSADKFIQEKTLVERGGRYTIPCKTNFSQYIDGIIHDRSASGSTLFVEPSNCIALNNELQENLLMEKSEIAEILRELLAALTASLPEIKKRVEGYGQLALRLEICRFYCGYDWVFPEFSDTLELKGLHHPILLINKKEASVPIDISLNTGERLVVVSGPNTGGKTVSLKSVGLNHIIGMCGLPVFAKKARMVFFSDIRADIGDKQSLAMDLSTFSSHMSNIKDMLQNIGSLPLILFDELGTGTDPKEGAALALGILEYLKKTGAFVMLTTHFSELKTCALSDPSSKLYAVRFDYENFLPKYDLIESVAGSSNPILIAKRLGFPSAIIKSAEDNMRAFKTALEYGLEELSLLRAEAEHRRRTLDEREAVILLREEGLERERKSLAERLAKREQEVLEESFALLAKSKRLAAQKLKATPKDIEEDMLKTAVKIKEIKAKKKPLEGVQAGDTVFIEKFGRTAKILETEGKNVIASLDGIRVAIAKNELFGYKTAEAIAAAPIKQGRAAPAVRSSANEIVLVGKRVEEAIDILDKYIDNAQCAAFEKVYVIHGRGSGQLRRGVQEYLRTCGRIKGYSTAAAEDGGDAVTVVNL
jgi:DNA mismatch repair protein MutS2